MKVLTLLAGLVATLAIISPPASANGVLYKHVGTKIINGKTYWKYKAVAPTVWVSQQGSLTDVDGFGLALGPAAPGILAGLGLSTGQAFEGSIADGGGVITGGSIFDLDLNVPFSIPGQDALFDIEHLNVFIFTPLDLDDTSQVQGVLVDSIGNFESAELIAVPIVPGLSAPGLIALTLLLLVSAVSIRRWGLPIRRRTMT